jgi:hypothetical protein
MNDRRQLGPGDCDALGNPITLGGVPTFGLKPGAPFRPGDLGIPGSQREDSHDAQRGRLTIIPAGLPAGRESAIFDQLGVPGGHPTLIISVFDRGSYSSFPWRARVAWQMGAVGMFECLFDVGAGQAQAGRGNPVQQGVVWSQPCDLLRVSIINPQGGVVGSGDAQVACAVAWGASPYPFRRPLTFRVVAGAIAVGATVTYPVPAYARGLRLSASEGAGPVWTSGSLGVRFRDSAAATVGGDQLRGPTTSMQTLTNPAAVPLGAIDVQLTNQGNAPIADHALEWELSL